MNVVRLIGIAVIAAAPVAMVGDRDPARVPRHGHSTPTVVPASHGAERPAPPPAGPRLPAAAVAMRT